MNRPEPKPCPFPGKRAYPSKAAAKAAKWSQTQQEYRCACGAWHIGRTLRRKMLVARHAYRMKQKGTR